MGCLLLIPRLLLRLAWTAIVGAVLAILFARVDAYVERRFGTHPVGRLYRMSRRGHVRKGTPRGAASAVEGEAKRGQRRSR